MTLCIAEKRKGKITFAADSRIGLGQAGHVDFGVKILNVPVVVRSASGPADASTDIYNHKLGLAIIGSALNSYLVKETVSEVLQNLQFCGYKPDFSFEVLCRYVQKIFEKFSIDLCRCMFENGKASLVLGGYCPASDKIRAFFFDLDADYSRNVPLYATVTEILTEDGVEFYGSGAKRAKELHTGGAAGSFEVLKAVITDETISTVGGDIQAGTFDDKDFKIKVIEDYLLADNGIFEMRHALRGVNLYDSELLNNAGLVPSYEWLAPFKMKMDVAAKAAAEHFKRLHEKETGG